MKNKIRVRLLQLIQLDINVKKEIREIEKHGGAGSALIYTVGYYSTPEILNTTCVNRNLLGRWLKSCIRNRAELECGGLSIPITIEFWRQNSTGESQVYSIVVDIMRTCEFSKFADDESEPKTTFPIQRLKSPQSVPNSYQLYFIDR